MISKSYRTITRLKICALADPFPECLVGVILPTTHFACYSLNAPLMSCVFGDSTGRRWATFTNKFAGTPKKQVALKRIEKIAKQSGQKHWTYERIVYPPKPKPDSPSPITP